MKIYNELFIVKDKEMEEQRSMLNALLYSIISQFLEQRPRDIPRLARRLMPMLANDKISEEKRYEIIERIYYEQYPEDADNHTTTPLKKK